MVYSLRQRHIYIRIKLAPLMQGIKRENLFVPHERVEDGLPCSDEGPKIQAA